MDTVYVGDYRLVRAGLTFECGHVTTLFCRLPKDTPEERDESALHGLFLRVAQIGCQECSTPD
jgi:hypothetical protein